MGLQSAQGCSLAVSDLFPLENLENFVPLGLCGFSSSVGPSLEQVSGTTCSLNQG